MHLLQIRMPETRGQSHGGYRAEGYEGSHHCHDIPPRALCPFARERGGGLGGLGLGTCQILYDQAGKSHAEDGSDMAEAAVNPGFVVTSLAGWQTFIGKQFV